MAGPVKARWWTDGSTFRSSVSAWVPCDPQTCFDYVSDFSRHNEWTTGEVRIQPLEPGPVAVGKRYNAIGVQAGKEWPAELVVTDFEPPTVFEFTATGGPIPVPEDNPHRHRFTFTPESGGTRLDLERWDAFVPNWRNSLLRALLPLWARLPMRIRSQTVANLQQRLEEASG